MGPGNGIGDRNEVNLGTRTTLADIGATIAEIFKLNLPKGKSFLGQMTQ